MSLFQTFGYMNAANIKNAIHHFHTFGCRSMLRKTLDYIEFTKKYNAWHNSHDLSVEILDRQRQHSFSFQPVISIIVPVYKTPADFLRQMIDSVISQTYAKWELCIADGSADPSADYITTIIAEYQKQYPNILYTKLENNFGISGNTNAALKLATGKYIALLDHDDVLTPDALFEIVQRINENPDIDVIYTDEDKTDTDFQSYYDPYFKPDFNLDLLRSCNYITHFYVVKKDLALRAGGFADECNGSQDYDFILKTCESAKTICHIPKILYHWRIHPASVAGDPESKSYAYDSAIRALQNHLDRCNEKGVAMKNDSYGYYKISYDTKNSPLVSILLKDCDPVISKQIETISTYKNFEFISAPDDASGKYIVILYRAKQIFSPDWLEQFVGNCERQAVGIVSAKIYYKNNRVLESGLIFTPDGQLHSPFYKFYDTDTGYCYRAKVQQNCSFIGPYCFITDSKDFKAHINATNDTDFDMCIYNYCRTLTKKHLSIVINPQISVLCAPLQPPLPILEYCKGKTDPFYNPNLSQTNMYRLS